MMTRCVDRLISRQLRILRRSWTALSHPASEILPIVASLIQGHWGDGHSPELPTRTPADPVPVTFEASLVFAGLPSFLLNGSPF
jgi:hypothetical protein